jgi:hypothetical protein
MKFPAFYATWNFITVFTRARHWIQSWARWIQSTPSQHISSFYIKSKKSKSVPLHAMEAHGERRYSSYSFLISALDGGEWSASRPVRALHPGKGPPVPNGQKAGWASEPVWTQGLEEKSSASVGDRTPIVQPVVTILTELPQLLLFILLSPKCFLIFIFLN